MYSSSASPFLAPPQVNGTLPGGGKVATSDTMVPTTCVAGQLGPKAAWPVCSPSNARGAAGACAREEFVIQPGKVSTFRVINIAAQVYTTVCFQVRRAARPAPLRPEPAPGVRAALRRHVAWPARAATAPALVPP